MNIKVLSSTVVKKETAKALNRLFAAQQGKEFLFLSSGGSSLGLLEYINPLNFGPKSTIGVLDERYSGDSTVNNLAQMEMNNFYKQIHERGALTIDTKMHSRESMEYLARRFEDQLKDWVARTRGTIIASAGIGSDAHTSGIMPYPKDMKFFNDKFNDDACWVAAYDAKEKNPHRMRVTTTLPFLRKINSVIVFVSDESKKSAINKLLSENGTLNDSPCRIWREISDVEIYTDQKI